MGATPKLKLPYVEPDAYLSDYPAAMKALTDRVELLFTTRVRLTTVFTATAGWALTLNQFDIMGPFYLMLLQGSRTGAALTRPASGDIGNVALATFDNTAYSLMSYGPLATGGTGRIVSGYISGPNVNIGAVAGSTDLATGEQFSLVGMGWINPGPYQ